MQCPHMNFLATNLPWIVNYAVAVETCVGSRPVPEWTAAVGTAFAYSSYMEMLVTLVCVVLFTQTGVMHMKKKVAISLLLQEDAGIAEIDKNQQKVEELERKVNELIAAQGGASMDLVPPTDSS